jgi:two-component system chemotaxis response regulator CheB
LDNPISVLIVDDSALMRKVLKYIIDQHSDVKVVGIAMNGLFALKKLERLDIDIITLDLEMPEMGGIDFLKERKKRGIKTPVIIISSQAKKGARITMEALTLGASDFVLKPSGSDSKSINEIGEELINLIRIYGKRHQDGRNYTFNRPHEKKEYIIPKQKSAPAIKKKVKKFIGKIEIIAIGISTGGPNALRKIFQNLNKNLPPILVVQHMPAGFTKEFANSLNKICPLEVKEANDADIIKHGRILIAPGDMHITIEKKKLACIIKLNNIEPVNGHRPSVGVLFNSVSETYGSNCLAIIMTGMGRDGSLEIGSIYNKGGLTIAQESSSCIVYGMPKVAVESGLIHKVIPLNKMAETINNLSKEFS